MLFAYPYYILPIIFPGLVWMGLGQVMFGMAQLAIHGIVINRKMLLVCRRERPRAVVGVASGNRVAGLRGAGGRLPARHQLVL